MKSVLLLGLLGTALAGPGSFSYNTVIAANQTVKENICKDTVKNLLICASSKEYNSQSQTWTTGTCLPDFQPTFSRCKGAALAAEDAVPTSLPTIGYPAYALATTVTKSLQLQGLVAIPAQDSKLRGINCGICSKFTKKLLECALPATPTTGQSAEEAITAAISACLTTNWDQVLYDICHSEAAVAPVELDSAGKVSYVFVSPVLAVGATEETCSSVEAKAKDNGAVFARVGKSFIHPAGAVSG